MDKKKKPAGRALFVKVKTARGRKNSSTQWLQRQFNDPYVHLAQKEGYRSRAAYKLIEINEKFQIINPESVVIDLGCTPGGWSQVVAGIINEKGKLLSIDLNEMDEIPNCTFLQMDFMSEEAQTKIKESLNGQKADLVMSDMAAPACGHPPTDHIRIMDLCETAFNFAIQNLNLDGCFVAKILQGGTENQLLIKMKKAFAKVKHFKPNSSRKDSSESYVIAKGFRG